MGIVVGQFSIIAEMHYYICLTPLIKVGELMFKKLASGTNQNINLNYLL